MVGLGILILGQYTSLCLPSRKNYIQEYILHNGGYKWIVIMQYHTFVHSFLRLTAFIMIKFV